jgi:hypothetical protein
MSGANQSMIGEHVQRVGPSVSLRDRLRGAPAAGTFGLYILIAIPLILLALGRHRWFFGDEWSFLAERSAGNWGDLFRSHAEHWSTIPVLIYRALFNIFGLRTYMPYQAAVVAAHLGTAILLRVVMTRAGVRQWTATVVAAGFVLFGPGQENILWAFQIGFVGSLMFGLVQLVLSDHDGPIDRRDVGGLAAGAAGLMCSGVSLPMTAVVALATLTRRGWKAAAFHVVPLAVAYSIWYLATSPGGIRNPYHRIANASEITRFVWSGIRGTFVAVGAYSFVGAALGVLFVVGCGLAWTRVRDRTPFCIPGSLLVGALLFLVGTSVTRWFVTPTADSQSRYIYTLAALFLPALAIAVDTVIMRWRVLTPLILGALLIATAKNATGFNSAPFTSSYFREQKQLVLTMAHSKQAQAVPAYVRPNPWYSIGWLQTAATNGDVPHAGPATPALNRQIRFVLSIAQIDTPPTSRCESPTKAQLLHPRRGDRLSFRFAGEPEVGASYFVQDAVTATWLTAGGRPAASQVFKAEFGQTLEFELNMPVRLAPTDSRESLVLCRSRDQHPYPSS